MRLEKAAFRVGFGQYLGRASDAHDSVYERDSVDTIARAVVAGQDFGGEPCATSNQAS